MVIEIKVELYAFAAQLEFGTVHFELFTFTAVLAARESPYTFNRVYGVKYLVSDSVYRSLP